MNDTLNKILSLLKEKNIAKGKFLKDLGFNKSALAGWESGEHASYKRKLPEIAEYLDVSLDWLAGNEQKNKPTAENGELYKLNEREKEMLLAFRAQSKEVQDAALRVAGVDPDSIFPAHEK